MNVIDERPAKKMRGSARNFQYSESKSPYDLKMEALKSEAAKQGCGYMIVKGIQMSDRDSGDSSEDGEDGDETEHERLLQGLSKEAVDQLRFVFMPKERQDALDTTRKLILGEQAEAGMLMFDTSFSYDILGAYDDFKRLYSRAKNNPKQKFNLLFGFTQCLGNYDIWMYDHECGWGDDFGGNRMVNGLGRMWSNLFTKHQSAELGVDATFSEPGVKECLKRFKQIVENVDMGDEKPLKFKF
jgi:hypothetical protein